MIRIGRPAVSSLFFNLRNQVSLGGKRRIVLEEEPGILAPFGASAANAPQRKRFGRLSEAQNMIGAISLPFHGCASQPLRYFNGQY
jgi:hypothetical protein